MPGRPRGGLRRRKRVGGEAECAAPPPLHPVPLGPAAKEFRKLVSTPLLIIEKVGCLPSDIERGGQPILPAGQLPPATNERVSVFAAAMIDRLGHHAEAVNLKGDSYRR